MTAHKTYIRMRTPLRLGSLLVSALLLIILFRIIDISDVISLLLKLDFRWLAVYILLALAGVLLRAQRYRLLLGRGITVPHLFWVTAIRNLFIDLLPARSGALSYIYILKKRYRVPVFAGTSTMILAAIFDYLVFVPLLMLALALSAADIGLPVGTILTAAAVLFAVMILLTVRLEALLGAAASLMSRLIVRLGSRSWMEKGRRGIRDLGRDLERIRMTGGMYGNLVWITFFIRAGKYAALYFLLASFLAGSGAAISQIMFPTVLLGIAAAEISSTLPIHSPGGLGTWDMAWALAFAAMGYDLKVAAASGLAIHLASKVFEYLLGITGILILFGRRDNEDNA